ncbi:MAG: hypothetical protein ACW963_04975, partial [Candidatus Sifarchaeia archaeon]
MVAYLPSLCRIDFPKNRGWYIQQRNMVARRRYEAYFRDIVLSFWLFSSLSQGVVKNHDKDYPEEKPDGHRVFVAT